MDYDQFVREHEWLVKAAVFKYIQRPNLTARRYKLEDTDFFQIARIAMWEAARDFNPSRTNMELYSFIFWKIKCRLYGELERLTYGNRAGELETASFSVPLAESQELLGDLLPDPRHNVEKAVIRQLMFDEAMSLLTERERLLLLYRINGFTFEEIAKMMGMKSIGKLPDQLERAVKKINPEFTIKSNTKHGEAKDTFIHLYKQGLSSKEVCSVMGIHPSTFRYYKATLKDRLAV